MKIVEVIGSFAVQDQEGVAPVGNLMPRIANAFTRSGQVKLPLNLQSLDAQSVTTLPPLSPVSREDIPPEPSAPMSLQTTTLPLQRSGYRLTRLAAGTRGWSGI